MIKNNNAESLVWIIIWVFILSFIVLWVTNLLINSKDIVDTYDNKKIINLLKNNTENIIKEIDTSAIQESEIFYLHKNNSTYEFEVFTWTTNAEYKYIDKYWTKVNDLTWTTDTIYSRTLLLERDDTSIWSDHQIIKVSIKKLIKN